MKIIRLTASNVKRLRAVEIRPDGALVTITGKNEAGKSSVLDSIEYALAGKGAACPQPVRRGTKKAEIVCDLGDLVVRRVFTSAGNTALQVTAKGEEVTSPQKVLDALVGQLTFDPLGFSRLAPKERGVVLRSVVGLDTSELEEDRGRAYERRATVNRTLKEAEARLAGAPGPHEGAPPAETRMDSVLQQMAAAEKENQANAEVRRKASGLRTAAAMLLSDVESLRAALAEKEQQLADAEADAVVAEAEAGRRLDVPVAQFREQLARLEADNRLARENAAHAKLQTEVDVLRADSTRWTRKLEQLDEEKDRRLREVTFPVTGLGFNDDGLVTVDGLPFEQASQARRLQVSVALGLAANPKLRVMLIRDGSLLDADGMRTLAEMAKEYDAQLWVERVEGDQEGAVVIEDGSVLGAIDPDTHTQGVQF